MESNHPIPQDVTGFQFKLIGSMTLKQFGYIAVGGVLALIFFLNIHNILIKLPIVILFAGTGAAMAFLPYEGRPLDVMAMHFFKALFTPNQYLYEKIGGHLSFLSMRLQPALAKAPTAGGPVIQQTGPVHYTSDELKKNQKLQAYLHTMTAAPKNVLDKKEQDRLSSYQSLATMQPALTAAPASLPTPQASVMPPQQSAPQTVQVIAAPPQTPASQPLQVQQVNTKAQLDDIVSQKKQLESELMSLKQQLTTHKQQVSAPAPIPAPIPLVPASAPMPTTQSQSAPTAKPQVIAGLPTASTPTARMSRRTTFARNLTRPEAANAGLPSTPDAPNIIVGIVKDPRGNAIANLLVEIKDAQGNPIRAFKTNLLGQFASATPLANGTYTIEFEDPKAQHTLTPIQVEAKGGVLQPIEVISVDARELLRQQLFD